MIIIIVDAAVFLFQIEGVGLDRDSENCLDAVMLFSIRG